MVPGLAGSLEVVTVSVLATQLPMQFIALTEMVAEVQEEPKLTVTDVPPCPEAIDAPAPVTPQT